MNDRDFSLNNLQIPTLWQPSRQVIANAGIDLVEVKNQIDVLQKTTDQTTTAVSPDAPQQVTSVSATESPFKTQDGTMKSNVAVSFTVNTSDTSFDHVQIWFTGYNGN